MDLLMGLHCQRARGVAGFADEVRDADAAIAVAQQGEVADVRDLFVELGRTVQVSDLVLRQAAWPAADLCMRRIGRRAEDGAELGEGCRATSSQVASPRRCGRGAAEEGAEDARAGRSAVRELLVNEGAGEERGLSCGAKYRGLPLRSAPVEMTEFSGGTRKPKPGGTVNCAALSTGQVKAARTAELASVGSFRI